MLRTVVVDAQHAPPDLAPNAVTRVRSERLTLTERDERGLVSRPTHEFGEEPRLPETRLCRDSDDASTAASRLSEPGLERLELGLTADDRQLIPRLTSHAAARNRRQRADGDRSRLAFHLQVVEPLPDEPLARKLPDRLLDEDSSRRSLRHQPCGEVHSVSETDERSPHYMPVRAASEPAIRDADLDLGRLGRLLEPRYLESRRRGPRGVVLVRKG